MGDASMISRPDVFLDLNFKAPVSKLLTGPY